MENHSIESSFSQAELSLPKRPFGSILSLLEVAAAVAMDTATMAAPAEVVVIPGHLFRLI